MYGVGTRVYELAGRVGFVHQEAISYIGRGRVFAGDDLLLYLRRKGIPVTRRIIISKGNELLRVPYDCLMYVSSDGNYSIVVTVDGKSRLVSYQLGQIEDAINDQLGDDGMIFLRLGRSLIINTEFIHFIDVGRQQLILSDCKGSFHELTASKEVLAKLKAYVESLEKGNNGQTRR